MGWFQKQLGLKIWAAIWLFVLLLVLGIPVWREDAREQWQGQLWHRDTAPSGGLGGLRRGLTDSRIESIAARAPDDIDAQLELTIARYGNFSPDRSRIDAYFASFAALSRRFPRENAVRKSWLLDTTRGSLRIETEAAYADLPAHQRPGFRENWLAAPQLEAALGAAREGARIEPKNSFFPWLEATLSFALQRPDDAIKAVERAARCRYFDDGLIQMARRRIALLGRVQSVGWSDRARITWGVLLPHLGRIRASARAAMEVSRQAHARGDEGRALQIAASVARAGATISNSKGLLLTVAVGDAIQHLAWQGALKNAGREEKEPSFPDDQTFFGKMEHLTAREEHRARVAQKVAIYARELGQESSMRDALASFSRLKGGRLGAVYGDPGFAGAFQGFISLSKFFWLQTRLLWLSLAGAGVWIAMLALSPNQVPPPELRRTTASLAAFCVGATAVFLGVGVAYFGLGSMETGLLSENQKVSELGLEYEKNLGWITAFLWMFPAGLFSLFEVIKGVKGAATEQPPRGAGVISRIKTIIYVSIALSLAAAWLVSFLGDAAMRSQAEDSVTTALQISLFGALFFHVALPGEARARLAALLFWLVPLIVWAACLDFGTFIRSDRVVPTFALICLLLGASVALSPSRDAARMGFKAGDAGAILRLQTLLYGSVAGSMALVFLLGPKTYPILSNSYSIALALSITSIGVAGGFHVVRARGEARIAALLFWCVPLILLGARTMLHPIYEANFIAFWLVIALLLLFCSARLVDWKPALAIQGFGCDLRNRVRILAATLAVASSLAYLGVKITALPAESRMNTLIDRQLQIGEVAWLEQEVARDK